MVPAVSHGDTQFLGVDFDFSNKVVFFTDFHLESVLMKSMDAPMSDESFVWSKWLYQPEGVAYDWTAQLLYVTDHKFGTITVVQPFKKQARIARDDLQQPRDIVVHPQKGSSHFCFYPGLRILLIL